MISLFVNSFLRQVLSMCPWLAQNSLCGHAGLELRDPPTSAFQVVELKTCAITSQLHLFLKKKVNRNEQDKQQIQLSSFKIILLTQTSLTTLCNSCFIFFLQKKYHTCYCLQLKFPPKFIWLKKLSIRLVNKAIPSPTNKR